MKFLMLVLSLLFSFNFAQANEASPAADEAPAKIPSAPWRYDFFPLGGELRYERAASQQMAERRFLNFALGVRKGPSAILFEYSQFSEKSGNATLSLDRRHEEYVFWYKQNLVNFKIFDFFIAGGAGAYKEKVTTSLAGGGSAVDSSDLQLMGGAGGGIQSMLFKRVLVSLEGRLMAGKNFDPNPQAGLLLRLGLEF